VNHDVQHIQRNKSERYQQLKLSLERASEMFQEISEEATPLAKFEKFKLNLDKIDFNALRLDSEIHTTKSNSTASKTPTRYSRYSSVRSSYGGNLTARARIGLPMSPVSSKFDEKFIQLRNNIKSTREIARSFGNFCQAIKHISDSNEKDTRLLKNELIKVEKQMNREFDGLKETGEETSNKAKEFNLLLERKKFKDKLTNHIYYYYY